MQGKAPRRLKVLDPDRGHVTSRVKNEETDMPNRSARTGRYISNAAAARHPRTSVREAPGPNQSSNTAYRSAATGRYVTEGTAKRNPGGTVTENG